MYLVTGANGQLGQALRLCLPKDTIYADKYTLNITDRDAVHGFIKVYHPSAVINCAAYTNVDAAENNEDLAWRINFEGVRNLAETKVPLVHMSTDYVLNGKGYQPYSENPFLCNYYRQPLSIYGTTKEAGEDVVLEVGGDCVMIIRTQWLYSTHGKNFFNTMRRLGTERNSINVVEDQIGRPTYALDLAQAIAHILPQMNPQNRGIYHYANAGVCSWYDFARKIMELCDLKCRVNPIYTDQYPTPAKRPFYSVLAIDKIKKEFNLEIRHWEDALKDCAACVKR